MRTGQLRAASDCDCDVETAVARAVGARKRVVLYAMDHSKLGNRSPGNAALEAIETAFGESVLVVIDACQMRLGRATLRRHVERGRMVLITGSKFFTGPPLSGALIVPPGLTRSYRGKHRAAAGPQGLFRRLRLAAEWRGVRASLPARDNIGETLRWTAALAEMEAWYAAGLMRRRELFGAFAASVQRASAGFAEVALLPAPALDDDEFPGQSIFPFFVRHEGAALSPALSVKLHRALNRDLRTLLPGLDGGERELAATLCHIGQPVAVGERAAVLRVASGARHVALDARAIEDGLARMFGKIRLLLRNLPRIEAAF